MQKNFYHKNVAFHDKRTACWHIMKNFHSTLAGFFAFLLVFLNREDNRLLSGDYKRIKFVLNERSNPPAMLGRVESVRDGKDSNKNPPMLQ